MLCVLEPILDESLGTTWYPLVLLGNKGHLLGDKGHLLGNKGHLLGAT